MELKVGIVGLPNVGKSTLFSAITNLQVLIANYSFATIEKNVGIVELNDDRLDELEKIVNPIKVTPATIKFIDIAGLVKGASRGEGLGNKFLSHIREVDAIIHVVRCFKDSNINHVQNLVDPNSDISIVNTELLLSDLETINKFISKIQKRISNISNPELTFKYSLALKLQDLLKQGIFLRREKWSAKEIIVIKSFQLITFKPVLYVGNISELSIHDLESDLLFQEMKSEVATHSDPALAISAKIEHDISELSSEDQAILLKDLNMKSSGLNQIVQKVFQILNLATYFTAGPQEVRAWTFQKGMNALECAGLIHSDFQRGFIKAEVIAFSDFLKHNGEQGAKIAGKNRMEGKNYIFQDGDITHFKFNV